MRLGVVLLATLGLVLAASNPSDDTVAPTRAIHGLGLSIGLPPGWHGRIYESDTGLRVVQAANASFKRQDDTGSKTIQAIGSDGIVVAVAYWTDWPPPGEKSALDSITLPLQIGRSDLGDFGCYGDPPAPATAMRMATLEGHLIQTIISFGTESPTDDAIAQANRVLESLAIR